MSKRSRVEYSGKRKRKRSRTKIAYWYVSPTFEEERAAVLAFFKEKGYPCEISYSQSKAFTIRVNQSHITRDALLQEFYEYGIAVDSSNSLDFLFTEWSDLKASAK